MTFSRNLILDGGLKQRADAEELTTAEAALLALGECLAGTFPDLFVYLGRQRQGVHPPAFVVTLYSLNRRRALGEEDREEAGFEITYFPSGPLSDLEAVRAVSLSEEALGGLGGSVRSLSSSAYEGTAQVTGTLTCRSGPSDKGELIQTIHKEIRS